MRLRACTVAGLLAAGILMTGCAPGILTKPALDKVKTVALASVYMNREFYNVEVVKADESENALKALGKAVLKKTGIMAKLDSAFSTEYLQIISYAVKKYQDQLNGVMNLQWVPLENFIQKPQYKSFTLPISGGSSSGSGGGFLSALSSATEAAETSMKAADYHTAADMVFIPADAVVYPGGVVVHYGGDLKDPKIEARNQLGKLCGDLGVDAVAIIVIDAAFEKPGFSVSFGRGFPATPKVASTVVLVNKDGEVAVNTGLYGKGGGEYFSGKKIMMLSSLTTDEVFLNDKSVLSYCEAIEKAALKTKEDLIKAYGKLK